MKLRLFFWIPLLWLVACNNDHSKNTLDTKHEHTSFTCSMHPQVIKSEMGTCPICGMDLVPFQKGEDNKLLKINRQGQFLANIQSVKLSEKGVLSKPISYPARLVVKPQATVDITARFDGRIEKIMIKEPGTPIMKGQAIIQIYSEKLMALQREYLMALAQKEQFKEDKIEQRLLESTKQKLLLFGQTNSQINQLTKNKQANPFVTITATANGTLSKLMVFEGQYVNEGTPLMQLENYNQLWVESTIFPSDAAQFNLGTQVEIRVDGLEISSQFAKIDYISPAYEENTQNLLVRASITNPNLLFRPGMQARLKLIDGKSKAILLPVDAVINDAMGQHVWIRHKRTEFTPIKVTTGNANEDKVVVIDGLNGDEEVVVKGAYMLYSEYQLKKGKHPLAN